MRYQFIDEQKKAWPVTLMCGILDVSTEAEAGALWIVTPELAVCGYTFTDTIGTD
ncbi:MAG: hypothetical protein ABI618_18825 [Nitrospirota bacterium]